MSAPGARSALALLLAISLSTSLARATPLARDEPGPGAPRVVQLQGHELTMLLRVELPFTALSIIQGRPSDGFLSMGGASIGVVLRNWFELEAGFRYLFTVCRHGPELDLRAGFSPAVLDRRDRTRGRWTLRLPLLAGHQLVSAKASGCDKGSSLASHALVAAGGIDATVWFARLGFSFRALGFAGGEVAKSTTTYSGYNSAGERGAVYGFLTSLGIAIPLADREQKLQ